MNTLLLVGIGVGETVDLTSLASEQTVEVGTDLIAFSLDDSVALSASCLG